MTAAVWICEHCGGPAVWTIFDDAVWYHCESECDGFCQMELFESDGVQDIVKGDGPDGPAQRPPQTAGLGPLSF